MSVVFNGKTYNNVEEMPANERQAYEHMKQIFVDANGNGIPDFMEGDMMKNVMAAFSSNVNFNGKVYNSLDQLPPEAREKMQKAFEKLRQLGLVTNVSSMQAMSSFSTTTQGMSNASPSMQGTPSISTSFEPAFQPSKPLIPQEPVIQETGRNRLVLIVALLAVLLLCVAGFAAFLFIR